MTEETTNVNLEWRENMWFTVIDFLLPGRARNTLPPCVSVRDKDDYTWFCILSALSHHDFVVTGRAMHAGRGLRLWVTNAKENEYPPGPNGPTPYAMRTAVCALDGIVRILNLSAGVLGAWNYTVSLQQHSKEVGLEIIVYPRRDSFMARICKRLYAQYADDTIYTVNPSLAFGEFLNIDWSEP